MSETEQVYADRNRAAQLATRLALELGYPAGIRASTVDDDWPVVALRLPGVGEVSWHVPQSELLLSKERDLYVEEWDGHDNAQKAERIASYLRRPNMLELQNVYPLDLCKAECELFTAIYREHRVVIKAILSEKSNEIEMYRRMQTMASLQPFIPKHYFSWIPTDDLGSRWLIQETVRPCKGYLVIEEIEDAVPLDETEDWSDEKKVDIFRNLSMLVVELKRHKVRHGDFVGENILVREKDRSICLIDFEHGRIDPLLPDDYKSYSPQRLHSMVYDQW